MLLTPALFLAELPEKGHYLIHRVAILRYHFTTARYPHTRISMFSGSSRQRRCGAVGRQVKCAGTNNVPEYGSVGACESRAHAEKSLGQGRRTDREQVPSAACGFLSGVNQPDRRRTLESCELTILGCECSVLLEAAQELVWAGARPMWDPTFVSMTPSK